MNKYIKREIEMQCLNCGKNLSALILNRNIRIHLCENCRTKLLDEMFGKC